MTRALATLLTLGLALCQHLHKAGQAVDLFCLTRHDV